MTDDSRNRPRVFDAATGDWLGDVVPPRASGPANPHGPALDLDGTLLVASRGTGSVKRFDPMTGTLLGDATAPGAGGGGQRGGVVQPASLLLLDHPLSVSRRGIAVSSRDHPAEKSGH